MAKRKSPTVKLPPVPWPTHVEVKDGDEVRRVRLARPGLERADLAVGTQPTAGGDVAIKRERVWRTAIPASIKALPLDGQAAFLDYAEAHEAIQSSTGACDPSGEGGGGSPHTKSPSHRALIAAERLRKMQTALAGRAVLREGRGMRRTGACLVAYSDLARWVACDGLGRRDILKKLGLPPRSRAADLACGDAIREAARRLAVCCGYSREAGRQT